MLLKYAHCTKATFGQLDRAPFSQYVFREIEVTLWKHAPDPINGFPDDHYTIDLNGEPLAYGDTISDCCHDAKYRLMAISRDAALSADRQLQTI